MFPYKNGAFKRTKWGLPCALMSGIGVFEYKLYDYILMKLHETGFNRF